MSNRQYIGRTVIHKIFGPGTVKSADENTLYVKFHSKQYSIGFKYPSENFSKFIKFDNSLIEKEELIQKLKDDYISFVVDFIEKRDEEIFSKPDIANFSARLYFGKKKINPLKLSAKMMEDIYFKLQRSSKNNYSYDRSNDLFIKNGGIKWYGVKTPKKEKKGPPKIGTVDKRTKKIIQPEKTVLKRNLSIPEMSQEKFLEGLCKILDSKKLGDQVFDKEIFTKFPNYKGSIIIPDKINEILHDYDKEVTFVTDHYILVVPGTHEKRKQESLKNKFMYQNEQISEPKYRDDISNYNGTFHLMRNENGRISSESMEDFFGDGWF